MVLNESRGELKVVLGVKNTEKTVISIRMVLNESRWELTVVFGVKMKDKNL